MAKPLRFKPILVEFYKKKFPLSYGGIDIFSTSVMPIGIQNKWKSISRSCWQVIVLQLLTLYGDRTILSISFCPKSNINITICQIWTLSITSHFIWFVIIFVKCSNTHELRTIYRGPKNSTSPKTDKKYTQFEKQVVTQIIRDLIL